jgi:hypothetical protein
MSRSVGLSGFAAILLPVVMLLGGCSADFSHLPEVNITQTSQTPIGNLQGSVFGGQQPIYQSRVYLMAASTTGAGTTSTSLLKAASNTTADTTVLGTVANPAYYVTTDGGGNFNITGDYTCTFNATNPALSQQLYLVSLSGNATYIPGTPPVGGTTNPYIGLMSVLGACPSTTPSGTFAGHISFIFMNEVSTVAAGYALAGFASSSVAIGSAGTTLAQTGLANAFANADQLYDITGTSPSHEARLVTRNGNGTVPYKLIDTMANILAACINSNNTAAIPPASATACNTLYNDSGNAPDTASAMLYIAQHPYANVAALYTLQSSSVQFINNLTSAPKDFTAGIIYTGTGLANPVDVAIDATGDAWVTSSNGLLSNFTPLGVHVTGSPFTVPTANYVAIDQLGNAWVTSSGGNRVYELTSTGATVSGTPYTNADYNVPAQIALDGAGKAFIANSAGASGGAANAGGDIVKITGTGSTAVTTTYAHTATVNLLKTNSLPGISQIAVDSAGYAWYAGDPQSCVLFSCGGLTTERLNGTTFNAAGISFSDTSSAGTPQGIAIDSVGTGWVAIGAGLYRVTAANAVTLCTGAGGISGPLGVAIDGSNNVWIANTTGNTVSEFSNTCVATTTMNGAASATLTAPTTLDIDGSGDVWIVNSTGNSVTELIGSATPVVRPLAAAVAGNKLGTRPQ